MYKVQKLYLVHNSTLHVYNTTECTPAKFQSLLSLTKKGYISVKRDTVLAYIDLNGVTQSFLWKGLKYGDLIRDQNLANITTWSEFEQKLTDELVIGYGTDGIPGYGTGEYYPEKQIVNFDVMNDIDNFEVNYADSNMEVEGVFIYRHKLQDLAIRSSSYDLSNAVALINGFVCFPVYKESTKTLYAAGGAHLCWQQDGHITPEINILDFSEFGGMFISKLYWSNTDKTQVNSTKDIEVYFDNTYDGRILTMQEKWLFSTPFSLLEYSPILVICGIMVFPDEYTIVNEHSFKIEIDKLPLNKALAFRSYLEDEESSNSGVTFATSDLKTYLTNALSFPLNLSSQLFAIVIKHHRVLVVRDQVDDWCNGYSVNSFKQNGLLKNIKLGTIDNYHVQVMNSKKELAIQNRSDLFLTDRAYDDQQISFVGAKCIHHRCEQLNKSEHEMVYLIGE